MTILKELEESLLKLQTMNEYYNAVEQDMMKANSNWMDSPNDFRIIARVRGLREIIDEEVFHALGVIQDFKEDK